MKKYYIIYEYNEELNDIRNLKESENREEIASWLGIGVNNLSKSVTKNLDVLPQLVKNKYFIMIDKEIEEWKTLLFLCFRKEKTLL